MQFRDGTPVYTSDGRRVGDVGGVVVDPVGEEVTHLIVEKGLLLKETRLATMDAIASTGPEAVALREGIGPEDLVPYEEVKFVPLGEAMQGTVAPQTKRAVMWYAPAEVVPGLMGTPPVAVRVPVTQPNIPPGAAAVETGDLVVSSDAERLGRVTEVLTLGDTVTGLVVRRGWLFWKQERSVPISWVESMTGPIVRLGVRAAVVEDLPTAA